MSRCRWEGSCGERMQHTIPGTAVRNEKELKVIRLHEQKQVPLFAEGFPVPCKEYFAGNTAHLPLPLVGCWCYSVLLSSYVFRAALTEAVAFRSRSQSPREDISTTGRLLCHSPMPLRPPTKRPLSPEPPASRQRR